MPKTTEIRYLEGNKEQRRYRLIETFFVVTDKNVRCASCILNVNENRIGFFDVFTSSNATKRYKEAI